MIAKEGGVPDTHLPSSSPRPSSKMRWAPSCSSRLSTYLPMALKCSYVLFPRPNTCGCGQLSCVCVGGVL